MADGFEDKVRLPNRAVHRLVANTFDPGQGRLYTTRCGTVLTNVEGAMLTTYDADCSKCLSGGLASLRGLVEQAMAGASS